MSLFAVEFEGLCSKVICELNLGEVICPLMHSKMI